MCKAFICSNFNFQLLSNNMAWHFCDKNCISKKVENMQERAVCFMFNYNFFYKVSTHESILDKMWIDNPYTRIRTIATEDFISLYYLNHTFMKEM